MEHASNGRRQKTTAQKVVALLDDRISVDERRDTNIMNAARINVGSLEEPKWCPWWWSEVFDLIKSEYFGRHQEFVSNEQITEAVDFMIANKRHTSQKST
jgi:hypothetical protein